MKRTTGKHHGVKILLILFGCWTITFSTGCHMFDLGNETLPDHTFQKDQLEYNPVKRKIQLPMESTTNDNGEAKRDPRFAYEK